MTTPPSDDPDRHDATLRVACVIRDVTCARPIDPEELRQCLRLVLHGSVLNADLHFGALFAALQAAFNSGACGEEHLWAVAAAAAEMDERSPIQSARWDAVSPYVGCSGSGKKLVHTVNISTAAALVAAAAGAKVLKVSSRGGGNPVGSLDVIGYAGLQTDTASALLAAQSVGIGFLSVDELAPRLNARYGGRFFFPHPFSYLSSALFYPAPLRALLLGVPHPRTDLAATVLRRAGFRKALVVCGAVGGHYDLDELSVFGPSRISVLTDESLSTETFEPEHLGLRYADLRELAPPRGTAEACAALESVLAGSAPRCQVDIVALNAGALVLLSGLVPTLVDGFRHCRRLIEDGIVRRYFNQLRSPTTAAVTRTDASVRRAGVPT